MTTGWCQGVPPHDKTETETYTQYSGHIQDCNGSTLIALRLVLTCIDQEHRCYHIFCARPMGWSWIDDGHWGCTNQTIMVSGFWMCMKFTFNILDMDIVLVCFSYVYMSKGWFEWNDPNAFLKNPWKKRICPICGESNPIQTYLFSQYLVMTILWNHRIFPAFSVEARMLVAQPPEESAPLVMNGVLMGITINN